MEPVDIIKIIKNNSVEILYQKNDIKLLEKIKEKFTDFQQKLFLLTYYCRLNFHPIDDYVIDLDNIWDWIGFSQKVSAKRLLTKNFTEDEDFKVVNTREISPTNISGRGGHNKENIFLNIRTFKKYCLKSGTHKCNEIYDYYIKFEEIMQELNDEENNYLKMQLKNIESQNQSLIEIKIQSENERLKSIEQVLITQFSIGTECIYLGIINNTNNFNEKLIKFGHTNDLMSRVIQHKKDYDNFILIEAYRVSNKVEIEKMIKTHYKIKERLRNITINGKNRIEIISYDDTNFTIENLKKYIEEIIKVKTFTPEQINELLRKNEELSNQLKKIKQNELSQKNIIHHDDKFLIEENNIENDNHEEEFIDKDENNNFDIINEDENTQTIIKINSNVNPIYINSNIEDNELTKKFNDFINEMCIVRSDVEESSVNMEGAFRIWNKTKPKKEIFHSFNEYLKIRFRYCRLKQQNKNQVVNGYKGVKLNPITYEKKFVNNHVETFLFNVCYFSHDGKILNSTLLSEYQRWKISLNKELSDDDMKDIKNYLNNSNYVVKSTIWCKEGSNEGYYGISLKTNQYEHKKTSSTGKRVEKVEINSEIVLRTWDTIAKAAEDENMPPSRMSLNIKNKKEFNNDYYYRTVSL